MRAVVAAVVLAVAPLRAVAQETRVRVRAEVERPRPSGSLRFDEKPARGDTLALNEDLDMEGATLAPSVGLAIESGADELSASYRFSRFRSDRTFDEPLRFNETVFAAGEHVDTRLTIEEVALRYERELVVEPAFTFSAGLAARYWRIEALLASDAQGRDADHMGTAAPEAAARARAGIADGVIAEAAVSGTWIQAFGRRVHAFLLEAAVGWNAFEGARLSAGYRFDFIDLVNEDSLQRNEVDLSTHGPWLAIEARF